MTERKPHIFLKGAMFLILNSKFKITYSSFIDLQVKFLGLKTLTGQKDDL